MDCFKKGIYREMILCGVTLCMLWGLALPVASRGQSTDQEIASHLNAIKQLTEQALEAARQAAQANSVEGVKQSADRVFESIWGAPSGLVDVDARGAETVYGWKTRWQSDTSDFELETPEKFGVKPAEITDPARLGIIGRGRYVRKLLVAKEEGGNAHYEHVVASLNNVIGWMRMDYAPARGGMPRVDLTYHWDAPSEFWQSTADTGWIFEVYSQALNILKTDYGNNLAMAKEHAAGMTRLLEKAMQGEDANGNERIEPVMMEGGLATALQHAELAGVHLQ